MTETPATPRTTIPQTGEMANIRRATVRDAEAIGLFQMRAWEQTYRGVVPDSFLDARAAQPGTGRWAERIRGGSRRVFVAESASGRLLGVASTTHSSEARHGLPALELSTLYVDQGSHGTGLASNLLQAAISEDDAHLLVFSFNLRAQRFYAKHGFERIGRRQLDPGTGLNEERWIRQLPEPDSPTR
ncbi:GNAT family N-acetyltransferase [Sphingomonas sp. LR61]|uniref:GNAT family N-acetyltransferase n=1 Tax=Sphingomonas sp. LR61 TaxID=3050234 RepID=UPI002FE1DD40